MKRIEGGEGHSPTYDRTMVSEKTQKTGTLYRMPGVADIRNSEARQVQVRREEDQMPQMPRPLLPSGYAREDT